MEVVSKYQLIVNTNNFMVETENELKFIIHKFILDKYSKQFLELESLLPNVLDYIRTVKELGNSLDNENNEKGQQILTNITVVSMTASRTQGSSWAGSRMHHSTASPSSMGPPWLPLGLMEISRQANRMSFREMEEHAYQEDLGFSLGHLGKASSQINEATKAWISKALQRQSVIYRGKSTIQDCSLGTAWSLAFTLLQGLDIINLQNELQNKVAEADQKYFSSMA
ncbi:LOW QUALITY PROTEIN: U4/U6 small nuclear ribonucleoprotein Prp31 [Sylvia borin]